MDQLSALSVFTAVAEEDGFAAAGRRLGLSPPTITRTIKGLEARLGARLFDRTTRSVSLTATGATYLADCRRILAEIDDADRRAAGVHAAPRGRVLVTASVLFGRKVVAPALFSLLDAYPEIAVSTLFVDRVTHLQDEGIDVAIRIAHLQDSGLMAVRVGQVRRILVAAPGYLDRRGRPDRPEDLEHHDLIQFASAADANGWSFEHDGRARLVRVASRLTTNTADIAIAAAKDGRGVTRVLSYQVADDIAAGRLQVVLPDHTPPPVPVHVVHKEVDFVSARVRAVVDHLVGQFRGRADLA